MTQNIKNGETNANLCSLPFTSVASSDLQSRLSGALTFTTYIIKSDQTSVAGAGTLTQPDSANAPGVRRYTPAATDIDTNGPGFLRISAATMEPREIPFLVVPYDPYKEPGFRAGCAFIPIWDSETDSTRRSVPFTCVSDANLQTRLDASLLTFTVRIVHANGTSSAGSGAVVQPDGVNAPGCCFYVAAEGELSVSGDAVIRVSGTGGGNTMEPREVQVSVVPFDPYTNPYDAAAASTSTDSAIRDRVLTLIEALTPTSLERDKFVRYRNEGDGDFIAFAQTAPQIRRFQVRDTGDDQPPVVSNMLTEERETELLITIAYPQNARTGKANALGRDDVIGDDFKAIDFAIGICGAGNFSGSNNCTPLGCTKTIDRAGKVDFLTIRARYRYWRSTT